METFKVTRLDVDIDNDVLQKSSPEDLKKYITDVVGPNILTYLTAQPKGWEVGGSCSTDRGCEVHVGGSFRF
jgi:hypothetical protein